MNLLTLLRRSNSAPIARDRLQLLLSHERAVIGNSDLVAVLREEILAVIARHVEVDRDKVQVKMDCRDQVSTLAVDLQVPTPPSSRPQAPVRAVAAG